VLSLSSLLDRTACKSVNVGQYGMGHGMGRHWTSQRPLLLNAIHLQQDPYNIAKWLEQAALYVELPLMQPKLAIFAMKQALHSTVLAAILLLLLLLVVVVSIMGPC